jgi:hypothetical protein
MLIPEQLEADSKSVSVNGDGAVAPPPVSGSLNASEDETGKSGSVAPAVSDAPRRYHGTVELDPTRVGRDASRIADEVISHLTGLMGTRVKVILEIEAEIPQGASDQVVRTVTENSKTLKFKNHGFEKD